MSDIKIDAKAQINNFTPDKYLTFSDNVTVKYIPLTFPASVSGDNFYGRDCIEIMQGNASNITRSVINFTFRNPVAAGVSFSAEYGNSVASGYWVDETNKILWLKFNSIASASDKVILRNFNPFTIIGATTSTAPAGGTFTPYRLIQNKGGTTGLALKYIVANDAPATLPTELGAMAISISNGRGLEFRTGAAAVFQLIENTGSTSTGSWKWRYSSDNGATWGLTADMLDTQNTAWV
jgi:hypothetical protein